MSKRLFIILIPLLIVMPAAADQVTPDDVIVDGSACIGLDCVNGEAFGFDTLILKENNLRIYFHDTSASAAFPTTDWRLVANDSANGGRNHFSLEDATAGTVPLTVLGNSGRVGLGTGTPQTNLHVSAGDTPTVRLGQSGELGWDPHAWDVGGNEGSFFVRDATAGTVPLRIEAGAVDDAVVVDADGNMTIAGTLSQSSRREVKHVRPIAADAVLAKLQQLEVSQWQYHHDARQSTHLGPMAEDFYRVFGFGPDDKHIAASDVAGVAMASAQALAGKVSEQALEIDRLQRENAELRTRLDRIEARLAR